MKKLIFSSLFAMLLLCSYQSQAQTKQNWDALYRYLATKIGYPSDAQSALLQGDNIITFSLDKGALKKVNVLTQLGTKTDIEVVNALLAYPSFKAAKDGSYALRTSFRLQGANTIINNKEISMPAGFVALSPITIQAIAPMTASIDTQKEGAKIGIRGKTGGIFIRGANGVSTNQPLYILDGETMDSGNISTLNPNDISSIEVLKDLSAMALYGKEGQNGVIVITTKKHAAEKNKAKEKSAN